MSRLDDELKLAMGRVEPSPDFTERVLRRIAAPPAPEKKWWESFVAPFRLPKVRWAAAAIAALLIVAMGAFQFLRPGPAAENREVISVKTPPAPDPDSNPKPVEPKQPEEINVPDENKNESFSGKVAVQENNRNRKIRRPTERPAKIEEIAVKAEGEIAKERLLLALQIAGTTLSDARKAIRGDDE